MTVERDRFSSPWLAAARAVAQRGLLKPLVWSLTRVTIVGADGIRRLDGAFVLVANHSSHLDAPLLIGALPRRQSRRLAVGAAADYFFDIPWRRALTVLFFNAFPIDRTGTGGRSGSARRLLGRGIPVLVFPEGTRSRDGSIGAFKPGAAALSIAGGVPLVPVALVGAHEAMPRGTSWPVSGRPRVAVVFGEPLTAAPGESPVDFTERVAAAVRSLRDRHSPAALAHHSGEEAA